MYSLRHFHLPHHRLLKKDFLYLSVFLRTFVFVSFFTFLPALIYKNFLYFGTREALLAVSFFYFLYAITNILFMPFLSKFYERFGIRFGLVLSLILTIIMAGVLKFRLYFFAGYLQGMVSIFWWASYYTLFLHLERKGELGGKLGKTEMAVGLSASFSPLLSGYLVSLGEIWFYAFLVFIILVGLLLVFKIPEYKVKSKVDYKRIFREIRKFKADFLGFVGAGAEGMIFSVYWPLFLYFFFKSFIQLGIFSAIVSFFAALFTYFFGVWLDRKGKGDKAEKVGVYSFSSSWLGKVVFQTPLAFAIFDLIHRILTPFFVLPLTKLGFEHAREEGIVRYVIFRELGYKVGNLLVICFMFALVYFNLPYLLVFVLAGLVSLLPLKVYQKKRT